MVLVEDMIREVPPITKVLCGSSILLQLLVYLGALTKYDIYFNLNFIFNKFQVWRIFTNFLYFGDGGLLTFFSLLMLYRCSKRLEEHTFRNKIADYVYFLFLGITIMTVYGSFGGFTSLSRSFLTMLLYLWSRYNQNVVLLIFGFVPMKAPYITWFFILVDIMIGESIAYDVLGIAISHSFYFFHEVYPKLPLSKGKQVLKTPTLLVKLIDSLNLKPAEQVYFDD